MDKCELLTDLPAVGDGGTEISHEQPPKLGDLASTEMLVERPDPETYPWNRLSIHLRARISADEKEKIIKCLLSIEGVASVYVTDRGYAIDITKAYLYDWAEIEPRVLEVLRQYGRHE